MTRPRLPFLLLACLSAQALAVDPPVYRTVTYDYRTDSYYTKGLLAKEVTADDAGRPYLETEQTYVLKDVGTGGAGDAASLTATLFPQLVRTDKRFYEGQFAAGKATHTLHDYDALGNVVRFFDAGDSGAADDVDAYINYSNANPACASRHIVGIALGIDVIGNGQLMRQRSSQIDCSTGDITQVSRYLANGQAAVTDLGYDPYGNLARVTGPANAAGQRYVLDYQFDPVVATHIVRIADSFGYASTATHHYKYGKVETTTDLNAQQTTYAYDVVGRASTLTGPYEQGTGQATIRFAYHPQAAVPYALTQHIDRDAAGILKDPIETLLFTDGIKRVVQTKKDIALFVDQDSAPVDSMSVSGRAVFDPTRMAYDVLDRNVQHGVSNRRMTLDQCTARCPRF